MACLSGIDRSLKLRITAFATDAGYAGLLCVGSAGDAREKCARMAGARFSSGGNCELLQRRAGLGYDP